MIYVGTGIYRADDKQDSRKISGGGSDAVAATQGRRLERIFALYAHRLGDTTTRRLVLLGFACVTGVALVLTVHLAQPTAMPMLFPPDSNYAIYEGTQNELFSYEKYPHVINQHSVWTCCSACPYCVNWDVQSDDN